MLRPAGPAVRPLSYENERPGTNLRKATNNRRFDPLAFRRQNRLVNGRILRSIPVAIRSLFRRLLVAEESATQARFPIGKYEFHRGEGYVHTVHTTRAVLALTRFNGRCIGFHLQPFARPDIQRCVGIASAAVASCNFSLVPRLA